MSRKTRSRSHRPTERANGLDARFTSRAMAQFSRTVSQTFLAFSSTPHKTVAQAVDRFRAEHMFGLRANTLDWMDRYLAEIEHDIGRRQVDGEFRRVVLAWYEHRAPSAANKMAYLLSRLLKLAIRWGWRSTEHDLHGLCKVRAGRRERILTLPQRVDLLAYLRRPCASDRRRVALDCIRLILLTGCRPSEGYSLERAWVEEDETPDGEAYRFIRYPQTKTTKGPQIRMLCKDAAAFLDSLPNTGPYYFPKHKAYGSGHIGQGTVWNVFRSICDELGWSGLCPMSLRHSFCTVGAQLRLSPAFVARLVGNTAETQVRSYVHPQADDLVAAADSIGAALTARRQRR